MKATKALVDARVQDILRIMLDGAEPDWDICEFVREEEQREGSHWHVAEGQKPLSYSQIRRYAVKADELIAESSRTSREQLLRRHLAQRRHLYAKCVSAADYRAALACKRDEAELLGLYPSEADALKREAEAVRKEMAELKEAIRGGGNGKAAEGTGGAGERGQGAPEPEPGT